jgi:hypothetical protein
MIMKFRTMSTILTASAVLMVLTLSTSTIGQGVEKTGLCHANTDGSYSFLQLPDPALDAHYDRDLNVFKNGHDLDFFADSREECDSGTGGGGDPGAVPEPLTILLFGAGVAGVGYATRRLRRKSESEDAQ